MRGAAKRPLDLIGIFKGQPFAIESKFIKPFSAFNLNRIEDHQIDNLTSINKTTDDDAFVGLFVAFWEPRTMYKFLFFDFNTILYMKEQGIQSIHKKTLELFEDHFISIKKQSFDIELLKEKRIGVNDFQRITGK